MTPKELMISRYEAFVKKDWEYIAKTSTHQTIEELSIESDIEWLKLEVLDDYENIVEFKAYYKEHGELGVLHEKSFFSEQDGQLKYTSGELIQSKIQRNETCPCGSGKKFKKCCMKV
jgi:SEC-C motif-containing protein